MITYAVLLNQIPIKKLSILLPNTNFVTNLIVRFNNDQSITNHSTADSIIN